MRALYRFHPLWLTAWLAASLVADGQNPCRRHPTQAGWQIFVDVEHGFCFEYPPEYKKAPPVFASGPQPVLKFLARLTTKPGPAELTIAEDEDNATIDILLLNGPFRPATLQKFAPTGLDEIPPRHIRAANGEFYYYGPGGGGVDYPDNFYFGQYGRTFLIQFTGPFTGDKTPGPATKEIERKVLNSFHRVRGTSRAAKAAPKR